MPKRLRRKMKPSIIFLSIFLASCKTEFPTISPKEKCYVVLDGRLDQGLAELLKDSPPLYTGHCRCFLYEWAEQHIGRISDPVNYDLEKCDKMGGFAPKENAEIYSWQEEIRLWLIRMKKKK